MKKLYVIIALACGSLTAVSQNNNDVIPPAPIEQSHFSIGVKGGYGHSFLIPYKNPDFMHSWDAGISAVYSPFQHFGFGLDVAYSEEGMTYSNSENTYETSLNYVRVPIKAIYFFRKYEMDFRPKISVGPTLGFLTNSSDMPGYNKFDFGANGCIGFNYRIVRAIWLNFDATYYQGLTDVYDGNNETDLNGNVRLDLGISLGF